MLKQGPDFHFEISKFEITRVDCIIIEPSNNSSSIDGLSEGSSVLSPCDMLEIPRRKQL